MAALRGPELTKLQRACITEGLRIGSIATARFVRVAPNETLRYGNWLIEPGVSISHCFY